MGKETASQHKKTKNFIFYTTSKRNPWIHRLQALEVDKDGLLHHTEDGFGAAEAQRVFSKLPLSSGWEEHYRCENILRLNRKQAERVRKHTRVTWI